MNIITKQPGTETHGSATIYHNFAQHKAEGETERMSFGLNGPITDTLRFSAGAYGREFDGWYVSAIDGGFEALDPWGTRVRLLRV